MTSHTQPLAARMRPRSLDEIVGQDHILAPGSFLHALADPTNPAKGSVILYGPPGTGKTSIASAIANTTGAEFITLSATSSGVKQLRDEISAAAARRGKDKASTVIFVDEIHRFSKAQQDALLPAVEDGTIALIGATTENPSFALNNALLSRSVLCTLRPITDANVADAITAAVTDPRGLDGAVTLSDDALSVLATTAGGDIRSALTHLEAACTVASRHNRTEITVDDIEGIAGTVAARYDRDGDQHYDIISAFIKSMRGSDPDAAVYWMARMIAGGEDPRFIARRLIVHASEDVGMADPTVLQTCIAAAQAVQLVGLPEARINLTQAAIAVATAPKSNGVIKAINEAQLAVDAAPNAPVPNHLRDSHYPGAQRLGHGDNYLYPHDFPGHVTAVPQQYLPDGLTDRQIYYPTNNGHEATVTARLASIYNHQHRND